MYLSKRLPSIVCGNACLPYSWPTDQGDGAITASPQQQSSNQTTVPQQVARPQQQIGSPPYLPRIAILGEIPDRSTDIPITSIFLVLFLIGAISHMITFRKNKARGHKFFPSFLIYVFCMARMVSCVLRIAWATHPDDARLAIAAVIFVSAGVLIIFLVNMIFAQRIVRSIQPTIGWNPKLTIIFKLMFITAVLSLAMACVGIVQSFYTLNRHKQDVDRDLQLIAMSYFLSLAFLPLLFVYITKVLPRTSRPEKFGGGRLRTKLRILTIASLLCTFGAAFRTGTMFMTPRRVEDPAWYHSKACFYLFNFSIEITVVYLYLFMRVDRRFFIPTGSRGPGAYTSRKVFEGVEIEDNINNSNEKAHHYRPRSVSSYAQLLSRNSSMYSLSSSEGEHSDHHYHEHGHERGHSLEIEGERHEELGRSPHISHFSSWSNSTLALPEIVHQSKISMLPLPEAPYLDIRFESKEQRHTEAERNKNGHEGMMEDDFWLSLPEPVVLRPFLE